MTSPTDDIAKHVRGWIARGEDDLLVARHTLTIPEACPYQLVAFHAQQCVEKYLKAFLVLRGVDFPYTHNIAHLLELCGNESNWASRLTDAEELTPFAITARYPGDSDGVDAGEARRAIVIAESVRETVRAAIGDEGVIS